ncbi:MAG: hypothetical protein LUH14_10185 [Clostridiaceae bacterium]|nr:hypothetical protein [Clostridiaceae bacterium]
MKNKLIRGSIVSAMTVALVGTAAFAGTSYKNYNTTVGRFNGNGYTSYQTKSTSGGNGHVKSTKVD